MHNAVHEEISVSRIILNIAHFHLNLVQLVNLVRVRLCVPSDFVFHGINKAADHYLPVVNMGRGYQSTRTYIIHAFMHIGYTHVLRTRQNVLKHAFYAL